MVPGVVVRIRVNPSTCMSVLDALEAVGVKVEDKSFATCVSAALNVLVATAKQSGVLPEPDPFQFSERMKYHTGDVAPDRRKLPKHNAGQMNPLIFPKDTVPDLGVPKWLRANSPAPTPAAAAVEVEEEWIDPMIPTDPLLLMEYRAACQRLTAAQQKKDLAEQGTEGVVWSAKDEADFQRDQKLVYGG